jgi:hypothetical protein
MWLSYDAKAKVSINKIRTNTYFVGVYYSVRISA